MSLNFRLNIEMRVGSLWILMKKRRVNTGLRQIRLVQNEMKEPRVPDKGYYSVKSHVFLI